MNERFLRTIQIGWGDMDANGHMRNSAYLDAASDVRMMYFAVHGFTAAKLAGLGIGPIALKDTLSYQRELFLLDEVAVTLEAAAMAPDGSRFRLLNTFYRPDGEVAATLATDGAWLDLARRRITSPPDELLRVMHALSRTENYVELTSAVR